MKHPTNSLKEWHHAYLGIMIMAIFMSLNQITVFLLLAMVLCFLFIFSNRMVATIVLFPLWLISFILIKESNIYFFIGWLIFQDDFHQHVLQWYRAYHQSLFHRLGMDLYFELKNYSRKK